MALQGNALRPFGQIGGGVRGIINCEGNYLQQFSHVGKWEVHNPAFCLWGTASYTSESTKHMVGTWERGWNLGTKALSCVDLVFQWVEFWSDFFVSWVSRNIFYDAA